ncbi:hypothetical protein FQA39_LY14544 [Lamprigera yunnana]|nr:hypothetical protein FQA39_LY14544 [Lamprigera yunnana]
MDPSDIYHDLHEIELREKINELEDEKTQLMQRIENLEGGVIKLCNELTEMKERSISLERNISELFNTAKLEMERKQQCIDDLQNQLDSFMRNSQNFNPYKRFRQDSHSEFRDCKKSRYDNRPSRGRNDYRDKRESERRSRSIESVKGSNIKQDDYHKSDSFSNSNKNDTKSRNYHRSNSRTGDNNKKQIKENQNSKHFSHLRNSDKVNKDIDVIEIEVEYPKKEQKILKGAPRNTEDVLEIVDEKLTYDLLQSSAKVKDSSDSLKRKFENGLKDSGASSHQEYKRKDTKHTTDVKERKKEKRIIDTNKAKAEEKYASIVKMITEESKSLKPDSKNHGNDDAHNISTAIKAPVFEKGEIVEDEEKNLEELLNLKHKELRIYNDAHSVLASSDVLDIEDKKNSSNMCVHNETKLYSQEVKVKEENDDVSVKSLEEPLDTKDDLVTIEGKECPQVKKEAQCDSMLKTDVKMPSKEELTSNGTNKDDNTIDMPNDAVKVEIKKEPILRNISSLFIIAIIPFQRREYVKYSKVFPFSETFDIKIPSKWYRRTVGALEIACGIAMAFIPNREYKIKNGANICLLFLTLMAVYSHYMVADKLERTAPALVFLFMLSGRLVVFWQLARREAGQTETQVNGFKQE